MQATAIQTAQGSGPNTDYLLLAPVPRTLTLGNAVDVVMSKEEDPLLIAVGINADGSIHAHVNKSGGSTSNGTVIGNLQGASIIGTDHLHVEGWENQNGKTSRYLQWVVEGGGSLPTIETRLAEKLGVDSVLPVRQFVNIVYDAIAPESDPYVVLIDQLDESVRIFKGDTGFDASQLQTHMGTILQGTPPVASWTQDRDPNSAAGGIWGE